MLRGHHREVERGWPRGSLFLAEILRQSLLSVVLVQQRVFVIANRRRGGPHDYVGDREPKGRLELIERLNLPQRAIFKRNDSAIAGDFLNPVTGAGLKIRGRLRREPWGGRSGRRIRECSHRQ